METIITNMIKEEIGNLQMSEWAIKDIIGNGLTGKGIIIPPACSVGVNLIVSTSSGKIQYSRSPRKDIFLDNADGGTRANWIDWEDGTVSASTGRTSIASISGVRGISTSGTIIVEVIASSN